MAAQMTFDWAPPTPPLERIGPAISYYGSKWQAAWRYPAPEYDTVVEPFAGGAGYALRWWDRDVRLLNTHIERLEAHLAHLEGSRNA